MKHIIDSIEKLAIEQQPQIKPLWLVIDEQGYPIHCASYKEACNEHINDAINDFDLTDAKYWKVVEAEPKALQSSEPVADILKIETVQAVLPNGVAVSNVYDAYQEGLKTKPSTVPIEEHNKRIAELQATNKKLLDALIDCVMSLKGYRMELNDNQPCDAERKGEQAIADAEGVEG